jgi:hypothetical protein
MKREDRPAAGLGLEEIGEASFDAGAFVAEWQRAAIGGQIGRQAFAIFRGLDFYANERQAGFLSLDYSACSAVDIEEIIRETMAGFQGKFPDGDAPARSDDGFFAVLDEPASGD